MNLLLLVVGVGLVALPGATARHSLGLAPRDWARVSAAALWAGLWAVRAGLAVTAAPVVLRHLGVPAMAEACHGMVSPLLPVGTATAVVALAALATLQARLTASRRAGRAGRRSLRVESWLGRHEAHGDHSIVVLPTEVSLAYAVTGDPPQIVLSEGLLAAVDDAELAAIVSHERCHLDHGHQRLLDLAHAVDAGLGFVPTTRRSTATLRLALERWADEAAADRIAVRSALVQVLRSVLAAATAAGPAPVAAFTTVETIAARLQALDQAPPAPSPTRRVTHAAPAVLLALVALGALIATCPM